MSKTDKVREALASFRETLNAKREFIEAATDESGDYDRRAAEVVADYESELAYLGELLADAVAEALGIEEE